MSKNRLRKMTCPQCKKPFVLNWEGDGYADHDGKWVKQQNSLRLRGCPSGGIYDVYIECPHCDYREDL